MTSQIEIFDSTTLDHIRWPDNPSAQWAKQYLVPLVRFGPRHFIANANVQMLICILDSTVIPLVVTSGQPANSDVCSPYSHFIDYTLSEMDRHPGALGQSILRVFVHGAAPIFRATLLDRVVYINNWLLTTNPITELSPDQIVKLTADLTQRFPGYALVYPTINPHTHPNLHQVLCMNQYRMVPYRVVFLFDPLNPSSLNHKNLKQDRQLLKTSHYEVMDAADLTESDISRLARLYQQLYIEKYTPLNLQLNSTYFSHLLDKNTFTTKALVKDGRIDAFASWFYRDGLMMATLIGYDAALPKKLGLYRQAFALIMAEAVERGKRLHMSAGAGTFKLLRGGTPCVEYIAVHDRHLPLGRRLGWFCAWVGGYFQHIKVRNWNRQRHTSPRSK